VIKSDMALVMLARVMPAIFALIGWFLAKIKL
jgi:hypothetical protein